MQHQCREDNIAKENEGTLQNICINQRLWRHLDAKRIQNYSFPLHLIFAILTTKKKKPVYVILNKLLSSLSSVPVLSPSIFTHEQNLPQQQPLLRYTQNKQLMEIWKSFGVKRECIDNPIFIGVNINWKGSKAKCNFVYDVASLQYLVP